MIEINFSPFPVLETERFILREVTNEDASEIFFLRSDEEIMRYINRPKAKSKEDALKWIELIKNNKEQKTGITWAIVPKGETKMIGNVLLFHIQHEDYRAEIGYTLYPQYHRQGIITEALKVMLEYAFNTVGFNSLEANINPDNIASRKVLEKLGFRQEAHFRENFYFEGKFLDSDIYCMLKSDYHSQK